MLRLMAEPVASELAKALHRIRVALGEGRNGCGRCLRASGGENASSRVATSWCSLATVFELIGPLENVETIARGSGIRELRRLERAYGMAN